MKDAKVTIFKEKIILQRLKRPLLNFRLKSHNGNEKRPRSHEIDALTQEKEKLREAQLEHLHNNNKFASLYEEGVIGRNSNLIR